MAKKRIMNLAVEGSRADLVSGNFVPLDGPGGTKKIPAYFVRGDLWVFNCPYRQQLDDYDWPDWDAVQDALSGGFNVALRLYTQGSFSFYVCTGRKFEENDQEQTLSVYEFLNVSSGAEYIVKYNNDTNTWETPAVKDHFFPGSLSKGSTLTDAASIDITNNRLHTLETTQANLTLNLVLEAGEVPNFAVEITAGADVTLSITKTVGGTTTLLKQSVAGGNALENGKFYQVTCVGSCWTLAEFEEPSE